MTIMDKVKQINADIAALPAEYKSLVQAEQTWAAKHPIYYALVLIAVGAVFGIIIAVSM